MRYMKSYEIRQMWLDFFKSKGHEVVPSASLVPNNDPSLLWINAGVTPLKKYFDGTEVPQNRRLTNAQKAIRTNDIDNVGKTARHHTFFEMLGNFSIGDYFRAEVLPWAVELLTSKEWFDIPMEKLYFTVYTDDNESIKLWNSLGVPMDHIIKLEDNFWEIGEGPCGPDTEIFFDRGEKYDPKHLGIKLLKEDIENDRYIEIWNIVFSQFNSKIGVKRSEYKELPSKNIDTGAGLERLCCIMQDAETNYETDLFLPIINKVEEITNVKYTGQIAFKVIADHLRSVTFAVSDGAMLSNEGRGYVLRRILRRACRYGKSLGMKEAFLYKLVDVVCDNMKQFYPYLLDTKEMVKEVIKQEEKKFLLTLENGEKKLSDYIKNSKNKVVDGKFAFKLYDTFGFPIELTTEIANESGFEVDLDEFKSNLEKQKELARNSRSDEQSFNSQNEDMLNFNEESIFVGYDTLETTSTINGIFKDGSLSSCATGEVILCFDKTPFYATMGGQVGDKGLVTINNKSYEVKDSIKLPNGEQAIVVNLDCEVKIGDKVKLSVDKLSRSQTEANHSGTHILNEALRCVLGKHVCQQGSFVNDKLLRFDFNNFYLPSNEELIKIEKICNNEISKNIDSNIVEMPINEAKKLGVQAMFGEKYGDVVRVVTIGFSKELCGGTHVKNTKQINKLAILSCESKGSGIFRVVAVTGNDCLDKVISELKPVLDEINEVKSKINETLKLAKENDITIDVKEINESEVFSSYESIVNKKNELVLYKDLLKEVNKQFNKLNKEKSIISTDDYIKNVKVINNTNVLICKTFDLDSELLKDLVDRLSDVLDNSVVFFANVSNGKILFVSKSKVKSVNCGSLVKLAATITLGGGGGRPDFAQAGGKDVSKVDDAINEVTNLIEKSL